MLELLVPEVNRKFQVYTLGRGYPRRYPRVGLRVQVDCTSGPRCFRSIANTLSGGGLFLTPPEGFEAGQEISIRFRPAKHLPIIIAKAKVCYVVADQGAAIEFTEINEADRQKLLRLIHQKTQDRRLLPRAPLATQVECDRCMSLAFSRDVSLGGMFIETANPLPVGSAIIVRFNLGENDRVVRANAKIAYLIERLGMGVVFTEIEAADREAIQQYIQTAAAAPKPQPGASETV
jgi:c-di-GMP-binding flagellar brake protein YcgR